MTFASNKLLVALTIVWAVALFGIDYWKNPRGAEALFTPMHMGESKNDGKLVIKLWMNHMCCTGCFTDVAKSLENVPGIKVMKADLEAQEVADSEKADKAKDYGHEVDLEITDLKRVDFMLIDRALRDAGLTAERMMLSGPRHYRLHAEVKHMCCGLCATGMKEGLEITKGLKSQGHFGWLDSFDVNKQKKLVIAYARYDAVADVEELVIALNHIGFQPSSVFAVIEGEGPPPASGN